MEDMKRFVSDEMVYDRARIRRYQLRTSIMRKLHVTIMHRIRQSTNLPQAPAGWNVYPTAGAFLLTNTKTLFNALAAESMKTFHHCDWLVEVSQADWTVKLGR